MIAARWRLPRCVGWALGSGLFAQGIATVIAAGVSDTVATRTHGLLNHDQRHGWLHVAWGCLLLAPLFVRACDRFVGPTLLVFGLFYLWLGMYGFIADDPFGLLLGTGENVFHLAIGSVAFAAGGWACRNSVWSARRSGGMP